MSTATTELAPAPEGLFASAFAKQIQKRIRRRIHGLKVIFQEKGVILRGEVPNCYTKQLAQQAAMALGATILTNDIHVR
jgi:hypothetical protein